MKARRWIGAVLLSFFTACSYVDGECWLRSEEGAGAGEGQGGGVVGPYGSGGSGDADLDPQGAGDDPPPECVQIGSYSASLFKFVTVVPDDGEGVAGGYQKATAEVRFVDGRQDPPASWSCMLTVQMPLRTEKFGKVSHSRAAEISADVLTAAAGLTMHSRPSWIRASFCISLAKEMNRIFLNQYTGLGASASAQ